MTDINDDLRRMMDELRDLPEPLAYIVLDPNWSPSLPHVEGHDAKGRCYIVVSPAVLDEMKHIKAHGINVLSSMIVPPSLSGVPVYRREDLPEGWPDSDAMSEDR